MKSQALYRWIGVSLLGSVLAMAGCQSDVPRRTDVPGTVAHAEESSKRSPYSPIVYPPEVVARAGRRHAAPPATAEEQPVRNYRLGLDDRTWPVLTLDTSSPDDEPRIAPVIRMTAVPLP